MRVVFRTDASLAIGSGHVMRCLALADALHECGAKCRFVCREHTGNLIDCIRQRGHEVHVLPMTAAKNDLVPALDARLAVCAEWLGSDWEDDAEQMKVCTGGAAIEWLIVDHYALDARWERALRPHCQHLMVIDDLADRPHDCDVLLDQNLGREAADYATLAPAKSELLIGPLYALLRPEFAKLRAQSLARRHRPQLQNLLISLGGVDKDNVTLKVLIALQDSVLPSDCRITVVMGAQAPALAAVRKQAVTMPWATDVRVNIQDMASLMTDSDLAIGAAGTTSWERCCLGVPCLMVVLAENQRDVAIALATAGAAIQLGDTRQSDFRATVAIAMNRLVAEPMALSRMSAKACAITQGDGVRRLMETLMAQMSEKGHA